MLKLGVDFGSTEVDLFFLAFVAVRATFLIIVLIAVLITILVGGVAFTSICLGLFFGASGSCLDIFGIVVIFFFLFLRLFFFGLRLFVLLVGFFLNGVLGRFLVLSKLGLVEPLAFVGLLKELLVFLLQLGVSLGGNLAHLLLYRVGDLSDGLIELHEDLQDTVG